MIITYTTKHFDPVHPDSELIDIEDIAHALSQICRGYGSTKAFWSVAEHSISSAKEAAARHLSNKVILACLLYHAANAYLPEIPESVKQECPRYVRLPDQYELNEKRIMGDFAGSVTDKKRANRLFYALNGRHPYRYFKTLALVCS